MDSLPKNWKYVSVQDVIKRIITGTTPSMQEPKYFENPTVDWFTPSDFDDNRKILTNSNRKLNSLAIKEGKAKLYNTNSLLLVGIGATIGKIGLISTEATSNQQITALEFKELVNPFYAYYWFKFLKPEIIKSSAAATLPIINQNGIKQLPFLLPPSPEQTRIVNKLDALFNRIDKSIALLGVNIKQTQALNDATFDLVFDDLSKKYDSVPLLKYVEFIGGSQPPKNEFSNDIKDGFVRLIQIRDYKSDDFVIYINEKSTTKFCEVDDVMIGRYGPPVFQILRGLKGAYNVALMKAVPNEKYILKDYLFYFLQNRKIQNYIISISQRSAGQSGVNKKALEMYDIVVPPLKVQQKVVEEISRLQEKLKSMLKYQQSKLTYLKALKASILDKVFKGEL